MHDAGPERRAELVYPLAQKPEFGQALDIAPGVKWMRMPLDPPLSFINVWAIADGEGWAVADTGMQTRESSQAWRTVLAGPLGGKPVTRVFVTHLHPDHIGLAGWMTRKYHCRMWITRMEYVQCRMLVAD